MHTHTHMSIHAYTFTQHTPYSDVSYTRQQLHNRTDCYHALRPHYYSALPLLTVIVFVLLAPGTTSTSSFTPFYPRLSHNKHRDPFTTPAQYFLARVQLPRSVTLFAFDLTIQPSAGCRFSGDEIKLKLIRPLIILRNFY
jgi:hypothetical protein